MHKTSSFILIFLDVTLFAVCIFQLSKRRWRRRLQHLYPLCHPYTPISNTFGPRTSILQLTRLPLVQPTRKCPLLLSLRPLHPRHLLVLVDCPSLTVLWLEPKTELMKIWKRIDFSNKTTTITTTKKEFTKHFLFFPFPSLFIFSKSHDSRDVWYARFFHSLSLSLFSATLLGLYILQSLKLESLHFPYIIYVVMLYVPPYLPIYQTLSGILVILVTSISHPSYALFLHKSLYLPTTTAMLETIRWRYQNGCQHHLEIR